MYREPIAWCNVPLEAHLLAVSDVASILYAAEAMRLERICQATGLAIPSNWLSTAGLLHDIGKVAYAAPALDACNSGRKPSFRLHEALSALVAEALALGSPEHSEALGAASLVALLHHHGMGKPYTKIALYVDEMRRVLKEMGKNADTAVREAIDWIYSSKPLRQRLRGLLPRQAPVHTDPAMLTAGLEKLATQTSRTELRCRTVMVVVGVSAVSIADTLVASLERNKWSLEQLKKKWVYRVLAEKLGQKTDETLSHIASLIQRYYT